MLEDNYFKRHKASSQISDIPLEGGTPPRSITNKETKPQRKALGKALSLALPKLTEARDWTVNLFFHEDSPFLQQEQTWGGQVWW